MQGLLRLLLLHLCPRPFEGTLDRGRETQRVGFEHVVGRASLQARHRPLLVEGSGEHHDGHTGGSLLSEAQRRPTVELVELVIQQDQVGREILQCGQEGLTRLHALPRKRDPRLAELPFRQFSVGRHVVQHEESVFFG